MFDSMSGWVPEHHKQTADQTGPALPARPLTGTARASLRFEHAGTLLRMGRDGAGNVDVGDYFDDPSQAQGAGDTGFQSGAAATGG